jgi:hypothetical protein
MSTKTNIQFHAVNQVCLYYVNGLADIGWSPDCVALSAELYFPYECVMNSSDSLMNYLKRRVATLVSLNGIQAELCSSYEEVLLPMFCQRFSSRNCFSYRMTEVPQMRLNIQQMSLEFCWLTAPSGPRVRSSACLNSTFQPTVMHKLNLGCFHPVACMRSKWVGFSVYATLISYGFLLFIWLLHV